MNWNPFSHLQETTAYPLSKILRSSFKQRMWDTFYAFNGGYLPQRMGLIDYLYPLPQLFATLTYKMHNPNNWNVRISIFLVFAVTVLLTIPKLVVASALTLLVSPFTAIAHFYFKFQQQSLKNKIKQLKINIYKNNIDKHLTKLDDQNDLIEERDLSQVLPEKDFDCLSIRPLAKYTNDQNSNYGEYCANETTSSRLIVLGLFSIKPERSSEPANLLGKPLALIKISPQNIQPIKALLSLNMFWTTKHLENAAVIPALEAEMSRVNRI